LFFTAFINLLSTQALFACKSDCCTNLQKYTQNKTINQTQNSYSFSQQKELPSANKKKACKNCSENCHCKDHCHCATHISASIFSSLIALQFNCFFIENDLFIYKENKYTNTVNSIWHPPQA